MRQQPQADDCPPDLIPRRASLLGRLKDWEDQACWRDFFNTYWKLIYRFSLQRGLTHTEAEEVVQATLLAVANDAVREGPDRSLTWSGARREKLGKLSALINEQEECESNLKAEIARELGQFATCAKLLA